MAQDGENRGPDISALSKNYDAAVTEARWRAEWQRLHIFERDRSAPRERSFVVDSPPPTVSGSLHMGHVFSYTHQDVNVRYRRMRGWNICYPMGWDDNGLPTERRVQNYFNVRAEPGVPYRPGLNLTPVHERKDEANRQAQGVAGQGGAGQTAAASGIPVLGTPKGVKVRPEDEAPLVISRQNFIELCHTVTAADEVVFRDLFQRLGLSIDWREEYATIDDRCRRIAQRSFLDLAQKGHVYQVEAPTMWDVDFQTAVAQAEVEDREKQGAYHDIEFGVVKLASPSQGAVQDVGQNSFIISTTRPELLAACVGVAVHPEDTRYKGLIGRHAITPVFFASVPIFASELVDREKGTGILMVCTFGDQTDVVWWREHKLALRQMVGKNGRVLPRTFGSPGWDSDRPEQANSNYTELVGKRLPSARSAMVEMLRDSSSSALSVIPSPLQGEGPGVSVRAPLIAEPKPVTHAVRYYEKGESPLEYLTTRQWFVRLVDKKDRLLEMGRRIAWHPDFMRKRYENWVENLNVDWCISRQRYFGVPIPVWYRLNGECVPDYSQPIVARPDQLPVDPMTQTPHGYDESQRGKPGGFTGEPDVFDTWFTSSLSPQIVSGWGEADDHMAELFPMDVRPQSHEIIRTWAFYTIAKAMLHQDDVPWRNVVISGWILDPDRKKMSKSKGNVVTPHHLLDQYGADGVRYWAASARLGMDTAFDEQMFKVGKRLVTKLFNAGKFVLQQSPQPQAAERPGNHSSHQSTGAGKHTAITNELDRAYIAELQEVARKATEAFDRFEFAQALEFAESFFWSGFADNYIELVKARSRSESDSAGRASAVSTLRLSLSTFLRLFAPFTPNICDEVWSWAFAAETGVPSVHTAPWPNSPHPIGETERERVDAMPSNHTLSSVTAPANAGSFKAACEAIAAVRKAKTEAGISIGAPLSNLKLVSDAPGVALLRPVIHDVESASGVNSAELAGDGAMPEGRYFAQIIPVQSIPTT